jgi:transposase
MSKLTEALTRVEAKQAELLSIQKELQDAALDDSFDHQRVVSEHIQKLKQYNELKDTALELIQKIAEQRSEQVGVIFKEIGIEDTE